MRNLAIIPARGGSKRIPRKNIKDFLGTPIIAYSITAAIKSNLFDDIIVSTDDIEIANLSKYYGASVPFLRDPKNSDDFATTFDVIEEVINNCLQLGKEYENVCCIYPCAPFCTENQIIDSYNLLLDKKYKSVFPVVPYSTPIQRALIIENGKILPINSAVQNLRSQDLEHSYYDAGQFYWLDKSCILNDKKIFTDNSGVIVLDELHAQDIDTQIDWQLAELKYKLINKNEN
jgi:N-acylneuraminate cytidylyltransferase